MLAIHSLDPAVGTGRKTMWMAIAALLIAPLVAMQVTDAVRWDGADFAAAALLLVSVGSVVELAARTIATPRWRIIVSAAALVVAATVWADAAVGVF